jgi:sugar phosphate permease
MRPNFFYGYIILALCFANMVVMRGVNGAFGVYYIALLDEFSWSRSDGATIASANFVVYAIAAPMVGLTFDRLGPRLLMPVGAFLVGIGLILSSFASSLWGLYFSYGIVTALGQGALSFVGHNALIRSGSCASAPPPSASPRWDKVWAHWSWCRRRSY